jgi:hypothetical protein
MVPRLWINKKQNSAIIAASVFEEFRKGPSGRFITIEAIEKLIKETRAAGEKNYEYLFMMEKL